MILFITFVSGINWDNTAYWRFDETSGIAIDSAYGLNNGTISNQILRGINGILNNSYKFNNTGSILIANNPAVNFTQNMSFSFWINATNFNGDSFIFSKMNGTTGWDFMANDSAFVERYMLRVRNISGAGTLIRLVGGGLNSSLWTHIVVTSNSSSLTLYQNGLFANTTLWSGSFLTNTLPLNITYATSSSNGTILDEIGFWNRTINSTEVSELYNSGVGLLFQNQTANIFNVTNTFNNFNTTTYETAYESYFTNFTLANGINISYANLVWNGTIYSGSFNQNNTNVTLIGLLDVPINILGNISWFWSLTYSDGSNQNLSLNYQNVSNTNLTICTAFPLNTTFINITFKNETLAQQIITASISSTWNYYLGRGIINKTYSLTNTTEQLAYPFCFTPSNRTVHATTSLTYYNSESQQRSYSSSLLDLTSTILTKILYLLPNSQGQYVGFQVVNILDQPIDNAIVNSSRSGFGLIESKITSNSGLASLFLDPTQQYTVCAFKEGIGNLCTTDTFSETQYTIVLGGISASNITNLANGISYSIKPNQLQLDNDTIYNFNFTIASTIYSLSSFGFKLQLLNGTTLASVSSVSSSGGTVATNFDTGNYSSIKMNAFWVVNGTSSNVTKQWIIVDTSGTGYSIAHFFNRLSTYLIDTGDINGLFGLTLIGTDGGFAFSIVIFLIIFVFTGFICYKYGFNNPASIMLIIFALVFLFDINLNLLPRPIANIPIITILVGILSFGMLVREVNR